MERYHFHELQYSILSLFILSTFLYRFKRISAKKYSRHFFFLEIDRPKFIKNAKDALEPKQLLYKTKKCRGSTKFDFITYCKFAILKTVGNWKSNKMIEKWNKIQSLEKDAYIYVKLSLKMMLGQSMGNGKLFDNIYMSKNKHQTLPQSIWNIS